MTHHVAGSAVRYLGNEADWRENEDGVKRAMLILDPTQSATEDGYVTGWHVYTTRGRRSQKVYLQIWRPVKPAENRSVFHNIDQLPVVSRFKYSLKSLLKCFILLIRITYGTHCLLSWSSR